MVPRHVARGHLRKTLLYFFERESNFTACPLIVCFSLQGKHVFDLPQSLHEISLLNVLLLGHARI
jgi:hypothetical protein